MGYLVIGKPEARIANSKRESRGNGRVASFRNLAARPLPSHRRHVAEKMNRNPFVTIYDAKSTASVPEGISERERAPVSRLFCGLLGIGAGTGGANPDYPKVGGS